MIFVALKRTPLKRGTKRLKRSKLNRSRWLQRAQEVVKDRRKEKTSSTFRSRRAGLPKRNHRRKARLFAEQFHSEERVLWMKDQPCEVTEVHAPLSVENAHMKTRAAGGRYWHIVPLLDSVHWDFDNLSDAKFRAKWGRSKASIRMKAAGYNRRWEAA